MKTKNAGNLLIFITAFLWSFLGIASKLVTADPVVITGVTGTASFCVLRIFYRRHKLRIDRLTILTGIFYAGVNITFYLANRYTTVTNTIVLQYCSPIFVLILNMLLMHYRPKKKELLILLVCFSGMVIFFFDQLGGGQMLGNGLALASGILFAGNFYCTAKPENDPASCIMISQGLCGVIGLLFMAGTRSYPSARDLIIMIGVGIMLTGVSSIVYSIGMTMTSALTANLIALSEVFMAPMWAFLLFHEKMGRFSAVGMALMLGAIIAECMSGNKEDGGKEDERNIVSKESELHHI